MKLIKLSSGKRITYVNAEYIVSIAPHEHGGTVIRVQGDELSTRYDDREPETIIKLLTAQVI